MSIACDKTFWLVPSSRSSVKVKLNTSEKIVYGLLKNSGEQSRAILALLLQLFNEILTKRQNFEPVEIVGTLTTH